MGAAVEGHVRGSLIVHMHAHVVHAHGDAAWARVLERTVPAEREQLEGLLISGAWYRVGVWNRAWQAHLASSGSDPGAEMRALAERVADADLHTVFKLTLKLASAAQVVRRADWLWSRYLDVGAVAIHEEGPAAFRIHLEAPTAEDEGPSQAICAHGVSAWMAHALRLTGASKASVHHVRCRFNRGSKHCEYRITW